MAYKRKFAASATTPDKPADAIDVDVHFDDKEFAKEIGCKYYAPDKQWYAPDEETAAKWHEWVKATVAALEAQQTVRRSFGAKSAAALAALATQLKGVPTLDQMEKDLTDALSTAVAAATQRVLKKWFLEHRKYYTPTPAIAARLAALTTPPAPAKSAKPDGSDDDDEEAKGK